MVLVTDDLLIEAGEAVKADNDDAVILDLALPSEASWLVYEVRFGSKTDDRVGWSSFSYGGNLFFSSRRVKR